jgi:hypothetical protein
MGPDGARPSATVNARSILRGPLRVKWEDLLPLVLHTHQRPLTGFRLIEATGELADGGRSIVGKLARRIVVVHEQSEGRVRGKR